MLKVSCNSVIISNILYFRKLYTEFQQFGAIKTLFSHNQCYLSSFKSMAKM